MQSVAATLTEGKEASQLGTPRSSVHPDATTPTKDKEASQLDTQPSPQSGSSPALVDNDFGFNFKDEMRRSKRSRVAVDDPLVHHREAVRTVKTEKLLRASIYAGSDSFYFMRMSGRRV